MNKAILQAAQGNMSLCIGICVGIEAMRSGMVDQSKSFFENAMIACLDCDQEFIESMTKNLQEFINDQYERAAGLVEPSESK